MFHGFNARVVPSEDIENVLAFILKLTRPILLNLPLVFIVQNMTSENFNHSICFLYEGVGKPT
jgi:hypothetical protein